MLSAIPIKLNKFLLRRCNYVPIKHSLSINRQLISKDNEAIDKDDDAHLFIWICYPVLL